MTELHIAPILLPGTPILYDQNGNNWMAEPILPLEKLYLPVTDYLFENAKEGTVILVNQISLGQTRLDYMLQKQYWGWQLHVVECVWVSAKEYDFSAMTLIKQFLEELPSMSEERSKFYRLQSEQKMRNTDTLELGDSEFFQRTLHDFP